MGDDFAVQYRALRIREGWALPDGVEDPASGHPQLWSGRVRSVTEAARVISKMVPAIPKPLIVDIGAGGAWAARLFPWATVIAVDLIPPAAPSKAFVRGDMRHLPLQSGRADAMLFAASLHYAPPQEAVDEAARVLRSGGVVAAVDSPIYRDAKAQTAAIARSDAYYQKSGFLALAAHYHPINGQELRIVLNRAGFNVIVWKTESSWVNRLKRRLRRSSPDSMVVARLT